MTNRAFPIVTLDPMRLVTETVHEVTAHIGVVDRADRHSEVVVRLASAERLVDSLFETVTAQDVLTGTRLPEGMTPTGLVRVVESRFQPAYGVIGAGGSGVHVSLAGLYRAPSAR